MDDKRSADPCDLRPQQNALATQPQRESKTPKIEPSIGMPRQSSPTENRAPQQRSTTLGLRLQKLAKHRPRAARTILAQNDLPY
jgi:hypothetical protein